jgi:hypothetical protein
MNEPNEPTIDVATNRTRVIEALRSGDYRQTQGTLRATQSHLTDDVKVFGYCCLGVVEAVRGCQWIPEYRENRGNQDTRWHVDERYGSTTTMSEVARAWLGVVTGDPHVVYRQTRSQPYYVTTLTTLNDNVGLSLAEIADVIEDQPDDWDGSFDGANREVTRRTALNAEVGSGQS